MGNICQILARSCNSRGRLHAGKYMSKMNTCHTAARRTGESASVPRHNREDKIRRDQQVWPLQTVGLKYRKKQPVSLRALVQTCPEQVEAVDVVQERHIPNNEGDRPFEASCKACGGAEHSINSASPSVAGDRASAAACYLCLPCQAGA